MPDFNKGDFTQQGVAGHVNANLRLNEKRLVNIDLTSNEAAEGCTIAGTVKDLLNDKVYPIGSTNPTGNINITNTVQTDVAQYATAQVVDRNLTAGNIKKNVNILGITGSYEGSTPTTTIARTLLNTISLTGTEDRGAYYYEFTNDNIGTEFYVSTGDYFITFDNVEYTVPATFDNDDRAIVINPEDPYLQNFPFSIFIPVDDPSSGFINLQDGNAHTLKIQFKMTGVQLQVTIPTDVFFGITWNIGGNTYYLKTTGGTPSSAYSFCVSPTTNIITALTSNMNNV